jgi:hypothetical protein
MLACKRIKSMKKSMLLFLSVFVLLVVGCAKYSQSRPDTDYSREELNIGEQQESSLFADDISILSDNETSFSYYFNIQRTCYVYIDVEPFRKIPFLNARPQSRTELSYLIHFSNSSKPKELIVSVKRQNTEKKINDIPERLNTLKDIVVESDLLRQSNLEKVEYVKFNLQKEKETELSIIDLKPETGKAIDKDNLVKEMTHIIDALYSRDASNIKWLYPLEQSYIDGYSVWVTPITLKLHNYDIKVPIILSHNTENYYNTEKDRNKKIFHKTVSLSVTAINITDTNWDVKFGTITNYLLMEL